MHRDGVRETLLGEFVRVAKRFVVEGFRKKVRVGRLSGCVLAVVVLEPFVIVSPASQFEHYVFIEGCLE